MIKVSPRDQIGQRRWDTYQVLVGALVELPLKGTALIQLMVVVVEALPVVGELLEAMLVEVVDPIQRPMISIRSLIWDSNLPPGA
jgi:hypothetical protein